MVTIATEGAALLQSSAALREKYCLKELDGTPKKVRLQLEDICVHTHNRGGRFPSPNRVVDLMCGILADRFNAAEAHHEGVAVQELPVEQYAAFKRKFGKEYVSYRARNKDQTQSVASLKQAFSEISTFSYGALSHCTLALGLMCIKHGAVWELPPEHKGKGLEQFMTGPGGAWDYRSMKKHSKFKDLIDVLENGMSYEILSWKILLDDPHGPRQISAALNDPQGKGVVTHEMECLACIADVVEQIISRSSGVSEVDYIEVKDECGALVPTFAGASYFQEMFIFVISIGGHNGPILKQLLEYDRRWVDHGKRTLSAASWAIVNKLGGDFPRTKVALLMRSYSMDAKGGVCPPPEQGWCELDFGTLEIIEELLLYFQCRLGPAAAALEQEERETLQASVCLRATDCFWKKHTALNKATWSKTKLRAELIAQTRELFEAFRRACPNKDGQSVFPSPEQNWLEGLSAAQDDVVTAAPSAETRKLPALTSFDDDGKPVTKEADQSGGAVSKLLVLPVGPWHQSAAAKDLDIQKWHEASILNVLSMHHHASHVTDVDVQVVYDVDSKTRWVVATKDMEVESLLLYPCCPKTKTFPLTTTNPRAVAVQVGQKRPTADAELATYWILPEFIMPEIKVASASPGDNEIESRSAQGFQPAGAASAAADAAQAEANDVHTYKFVFTGAESLHFFWAVDRLTEEDMAKKTLEPGQEAWRFNMKLVTRDLLSIAGGGQSQGTPGRSATVRVPILTNSIALERGDRLFFQISKPKVEKKQESWVKAARDEDKKRKKEKDEVAAKGAKKMKGAALSLPGTSSTGNVRVV